MSALTNRKELNRIRTSIILTVLCLCFVFCNAVNAQREGYKDNDIAVNGQGERCQYKDVDIYVMNENVVLNSTGQPVNVVFCLYHSNGNVSSEVPLINGKVEGIARDYYVSGKLEYEIQYKDGKREGIAKRYFENGKLLGETPFNNDKREGIAKGYFESGKLAWEASYKDNKAEGYAQEYNENGRLLMKILHINNNPISGICGNEKVFTKAELVNWENGLAVSCEIQR